MNIKKTIGFDKVCIENMKRKLNEKQTINYDEIDTKKKKTL